MFSKTKELTLMKVHPCRFNGESVQKVEARQFDCMGLTEIW